MKTCFSDLNELTSLLTCWGSAGWGRRSLSLQHTIEKESFSCFLQLHTCEARVKQAVCPSDMALGSKHNTVHVFKKWIKHHPPLLLNVMNVLIMRNVDISFQTPILSWILTPVEEIISPAKQFNWLQYFIFSYLYGCFVFSLQGISIKPNHQLYGNMCIMLQPHMQCSKYFLWSSTHTVSVACWCFSYFFCADMLLCCSSSEQINGWYRINIMQTEGGHPLSVAY